MDAYNILQVVTLAVAGWTLREVIAQGKDLSAMKQKMKDLPCKDCGGQTTHDNT